ncbi:response regulator [Achromobacter aloeverae]|uniref:Response regulator n=2 Tax=Achromobacter aloeverae TaxID=1750518 RepID=A0A4Q1HLN0_9BURK|nr:response regulator [Achromobacter aloeverae]
MDGAILSARKILVVEDEALVAMLIEDYLTDFGCAVVGPAGSVKQALLLLDAESVDAAVLDMNLGGDPVEPVAAALAEKGIPFFYSTGYGDQGRRTDYPAQVLGKPFNQEQLRTALVRVLTERDGPA